MNKRLRAVALVAPIMAATLFSAPMATADSGDGKLACNVGEICFNRNSTQRTYQKHFLHTGTHDNYTYTNVSTGARTTSQLRDNAYEVRNRSTCTVKVIDDRGWYADDVHAVAANGSWTKLSDSVRNQNDRHERC